MAQNPFSLSSGGAFGEMLCSLNTVKNLDSVIEKFNVKTLGKVLILMTLNELKGVLWDALKWLGAYIKTNYRHFFSYLFQLVKRLIPRGFVRGRQNKSEVKPDSLVIPYTPTNNWFELVFDHPKLSYTSTIESVKNKNGVLYQTEICRDICIKFNKTGCRFLTPVKTRFMLQTDSSKKWVLSNLEKKTFDVVSAPDNFNCLKIIPYEKIVKELCVYFFGLSEPQQSHIFESGLNVYPQISSFITAQFGLDIDRVRTVKLLTFTKLIHFAIIQNSATLKERQRYLFGRRVEPNLFTLCAAPCRPNFDISIFNRWVCEELFTTSNVLQDSLSLKIEFVDGLADGFVGGLYETWIGEFQEFCCNVKALKQKPVKGFDVILVKKEEVKKTINDEYEEWEKTWNSMTELKTPEAASLKADHLRIKPEKYIKTCQSEVDYKVIPTKEIHKLPDTLYLQKEDEMVLFEAMKNFRDHRDDFTSFGIPNKFNVLLYGLPGTGKTSTSESIATFLGLDLYNVSLTGIETNEQFQGLVDVITKSCVNGGILMIEDIDCQPDVVFQRGSLKSEGKSLFTLDYILNVLQGSRTPKGLVTIVTTNRIDVLDSAFSRAGRFDVRIDMKLCDRYQFQQIYKKFRGVLPSREITDRFREGKHTPAKIIFQLAIYRYDSSVTDDVLVGEFLTD